MSFSALFRPPRLVCGVIAVVLSLPLTTDAQRFTDVAHDAGLRHNQFATVEFYIEQWYFMTGGAAVTDYDGDGWPDIYMTRMDAPDLLYRNQGDGTFQVITPQGLGVINGANGCAWADIDNDGDDDLLVSTVGVGRNYLFIHNDDGTFTEDAEARGVDLTRNSFRANGFSVTFGDYDCDGFLDIHLTAWEERDGSGARLLHNIGATQPGYFEDVTESAGVSLGAPGETVFGFASHFVDLNDDRRPDLAVAADFGTSKLFWNDGMGGFANGTNAAGVGTDENGMGSAVGDINGDGRTDWFVTSIYDDPPQDIDWGITGNRLYRNMGGSVFDDFTDAAGVREGGWGWGAAMFDCDNDGDLDMAMTNGIVVDLSTKEDHFNNDRMRLWRNRGDGTFDEVAQASGMRDRRSGKALLTLDYDRDGDLDVLVVNTASEPVLYRNDTPDTGNWLRVVLEGVTSNRNGFGALVRVYAGGAVYVREYTCGSGFLSQDEAGEWFGLGDVLSADSVTVLWPSGMRQTVGCPGSNTVLTITEGVTPPVPTVAGARLEVRDLEATLSWYVCRPENVVAFEVFRTIGGGQSKPVGSALLPLTGAMTVTDQLREEDRGKLVVYRISGRLTTGGTEEFAQLQQTVPTPATTSLVLGQNFPNPFNPGTTIDIELPAAGHAFVAIYSVRGTLVRVIADREFAAGVNQVTWDGTDASGAPVVSGHYFYRLTHAGESVSRSLVLVR